MTIIENTTRYLKPEIIQQCFKKGQIIHVDKQLCGNGFSYGFLNIPPKHLKINIIIAPNKAVLIDKQKAYNNGDFNSDIRIKFFYKESKDFNFDDANVLFFVADSFLMMSDKIKAISNRIDKVLIDEFHSTEIQSSFRYLLVDFLSKVKNICSDYNTSITTVTASPNLFSKVDIFIRNTFINSIDMYISKNRNSTLKRIKNDIKNGENVVIASNSSRAISKLKNYKNILEANFIIGESLTRSLVQLVEVKQNINSNVTIISSRGFEGCDVFYNDAKFYFLEDRSNEFETFYIANLYQAMNRNRLSLKYVEYNRLELSNSRKNEFNNIDVEIEKIIKDNSVSTEQKQTTKYKKYHPFLIFNQDLNGVFSIKKNEVSINLFKERLMYDKCNFEIDFKEFLNNRNINIIKLNENNNRLKTKIKKSTKVKNLMLNSKLINDLDLFGDKYRIEVRDLHDKATGIPNSDIRLKYLKKVQDFLICKNYEGGRENTERENIALDLLSNELQFKSLVNDVVRTYNNRSIKKYGIKGSAEYRKSFKENSYNSVCLFILMFSNKRIGVPPKWIANRDYNLTTSIGVNEIEIFANIFNVEVLEVDVKNCFPRFLYALNGLKLPPNFYGNNKENKLNINVFLNDFFYNSNKKSLFKVQKKRAIEKFKFFGFDDVVINYLMDNFFECKFKGDLFNRLSFYEKKIISEVKESIPGEFNTGVIRRHDSVLIFNNRFDLSYLNNMYFLNSNGWFDVEAEGLINFFDDNNNDDDFENYVIDNNIKYMAI